LVDPYWELSFLVYMSGFFVAVGAILVLFFVLLYSEYIAAGAAWVLNFFGATLAAVKNFFGATLAAVKNFFGATKEGVVAMMTGVSRRRQVVDMPATLPAPPPPV
jgi:hypothetical protein